MQVTQKGFYRGTILVGIVLSAMLFLSATGPVTEDRVEAPVEGLTSVYEKLHLQELGLSSTAFQLALQGYSKLKHTGAISKNIISICDFTQSSNNKRLYVIDLAKGELLFNTLVAHGRNTGEEFAQFFSNEPESHKSSLGFYATSCTYQGEHGLRLKLKGEEPGFNNHAEERAIVMHGADYVCNDFISKVGRLGRSFGCPSVPFEVHKQIINTIKDGSCLFVYYPDQRYLSASRLLR